MGGLVVLFVCSFVSLFFFDSFASFVVFASFFACLFIYFLWFLCYVFGFSAFWGELLALLGLIVAFFVSVFVACCAWFFVCLFVYLFVC